MPIVSDHTISSSELCDPGQPVILAEDLSIRYRLPKEKVSSIKEFAIRWAQQRLVYEDFLALQGVDLAIYSGELFGVIGRNGAGKSTLLKVVAGLLHPAQGRVVVRGKVAPLLELGAGFHPELTGRENVYLYATLLGMRRNEIDALFDEIVDFAELWDFIDAPLRTYSTGMSARLGFAVASCRQADVLLVDEVLAVGDVQFQAKCLERMQAFRDQGATILYVTHNLDTVREHCDRAAWLDDGWLAECGAVNLVVDAYLQALQDTPIRSQRGW
jgi:lipopolysaccharide transport system ATP-binding protein